MYGGLGMSAPSLHRESTDSLIQYIHVHAHLLLPCKYTIVMLTMVHMCQQTMPIYIIVLSLVLLR